MEAIKRTGSDALAALRPETKPTKPSDVSTSGEGFKHIADEAFGGPQKAKGADPLARVADRLRADAAAAAAPASVFDIDSAHASVTSLASAAAAAAAASSVAARSSISAMNASGEPVALGEL